MPHPMALRTPITGRLCPLFMAANIALPLNA